MSGSPNPCPRWIAQRVGVTREAISLWFGKSEGWASHHQCSFQGLPLLLQHLALCLLDSKFLGQMLLLVWSLPSTRISGAVVSVCYCSADCDCQKGKDVGKQRRQESNSAFWWSMCTTDGALLPCKAHSPAAAWDLPFLVLSREGHHSQTLELHA